MSQTLSFRLVVSFTFVCLIGAIALAMPFDPVFRVLQNKGDCQVSLPDSTTFSPVKLGKAYPFGSVIRTSGSKSEATIALCDNHICRLMPNTTVRFSDETNDRENRTLHLLSGKVEVDLDQKNIKFTNKVMVKTAVGTATGEKVRFTVAASRKGDLHESVFECGAGMFSVSGSQFQAPVVKEGASLKVTGPTDLSWLRVQTLKGDISYDLRDNSADPMVYPTKSGGAIKITQRVTESTKVRHVVLWTLKPDGTTATNFTYKLLPQAVDDVKAPAANAAGDQQAPQQGI